MNGLKDSLKYYDLIYTEIVSKMKEKKYYYHDSLGFINEVINGQIATAMQIYWKELLMRMHFASFTSIMRNERWLNGINLSIASENYLLFTSSLRGLIESVADSYYSLLSKPTDVACNFKNIQAAINGRLFRPLWPKEFEESLIHFQHASKTDKSGLPYNKPLSTSDYINIFDKYGEDDTKKLYSNLCEVVHPAKNSISCFTKLINVNEESEYTTTCVGLDAEFIDNLINDNSYSSTISNLLKISISAPVSCLKVLNLFGEDFIESFFLESCFINNQIETSEGWQKIIELVEESKRN